MKTRIAALAALMLLLLTSGAPVHAYPMWAREYKVTCTTCHTAPPALNLFGEMFTANNFVFPGRKKSLNKPFPFPVSVVGVFEYEKEVGGSEEGPVMEELELFSGDSFRVGRNPNYFGSYFIQTLALHKAGGGDAGDLDQAFVTLPIAGQRGQWALGVGQMISSVYQYNHHTELFEEGIYAMTRGAGGFAPGEDLPGIRLDYFSERGLGTAEGDYVSLMLPFQGQLAFNANARLGTPNGMAANYFHRWKRSSAGVQTWINGDSHIVGFTGTLRPTPKWNMILAVSQNSAPHDDGVQISAQVDYFPTAYLALMLRGEGGGGRRRLEGVAIGLHLYPEPTRTVHFSLQHFQFKGERATLALAIIEL